MVSDGAQRIILDYDFLSGKNPDVKPEFFSSALILRFELLSERFWHGWWWRPRETQSNLDPVVDEPLKRRQRTDHDDTRTQTLPDAHRTHFSQN